METLGGWFIKPCDLSEVGLCLSCTRVVSTPEEGWTIIHVDKFWSSVSDLWWLNGFKIPPLNGFNVWYQEVHLFVGDLVLKHYIYVFYCRLP